MEKFTGNYLSTDDIVIEGKSLTEIIRQHLIWKKSNRKFGKRAIFKDVDFSNLAINPLHDIDEHYEIKSGITGKRYLYEIFQPKKPITENDLPDKVERFDLSEMEFTRCNFENSNLRWMNFSDCKFLSCCFNDAILTDTFFKQSEFQNCQIINTKMSGVSCDYAIFYLCNISGTWLRDANLPYVKMRYCIMPNVLLRGANCWECDFSYSDLRNGVFLSGWLEHAVFFNSNLQNTDFTHAKVDGADFSQSDIRGSNITPEQLNSAKQVKNMKSEELSNISSKSLSVFISYAWKDYNAVSAVDYWLRSQGIEVYRDEHEFYAGASLIESIQRFIDPINKAMISIWRVNKQLISQPILKLFKSNSFFPLFSNCSVI